MADLIFDLETLDIYPSAVVLSIGCFAFNLSKPINHSKGIYLKLNVEEQIKTYKRTIGPKTVEWWKEQSPAAKEVLKPSPSDLSVKDALVKLNEFIKESEYDWNSSYCWCRGTAFDFPILESLYLNSDTLMGYNTWKIRDVRTMIDSFQLFAQAADKEYTFDDIGLNNHNALDDCISDAMRMNRLFNLF